MRAHARSGTWTRIRPGVYVPTTTLDDEIARLSPPSGGSPSPEARAKVLALARISAVAAQAASQGRDVTLVLQSAALVHGIDTWRTPTKTHIAHAFTSGSGPASDIRVHTAPVLANDIVSVAGVRATGVVPTVVSVARFGSVADGIVALDRVLRAGVPREALAEEVEQHAGKFGVRQARELVGFADDGAESPWESWARICALALGLPPPVTQLEIVADGRLYYADLAWPQWRLIIEFDGYVKYRSHADGDRSEVLIREKEREDAIRSIDWNVARVTASVLRQRGAFEARVRRALPASAQRSLTPRPHLLLP